MAEEEDEVEQGFVERNSTVIKAGVAGAVAVGLGIYILSGKHEKEEPVKKVHELSVVKIAPPPPPPPPPPQQQQVKEEKMVEQPKMKMPEIKDNLEKPKDAAPKGPAPGPLGLEGKGEGPGDAFGLAGGGGGGGGLGGGGGSYHFYDGAIKAQIEGALRANSKTRDAKLRVVVAFWFDPNGVFQRAELSSSTGDAELDDALKNEVFRNLRLHDIPKDMPMPVQIRLTALRPG